MAGQTVVVDDIGSRAVKIAIPVWRSTLTDLGVTPSTLTTDGADVDRAAAATAEAPPCRPVAPWRKEPRWRQSRWRRRLLGMIDP
jgi:hypothetical protein